MLITHAMNPSKINKTQTPNRKIKHIVTNKNSLLNPTLSKVCSNKKLSLNKQNQNPNIRKSPSQQKDKPSVQVQNHQRAKQNRVKSQYYSSGLNTTKQSPIKKILFVKNLCYKSTKTSKNSSLDNKNQQSANSHQYSSLNHNSERNKLNIDKESFERKSYSNGNKNFIQNQSEIFQQQKPNDKIIQEFQTKDKILQNQSHASYRLTMAPNQLHPKLAQFNQSYSSLQNQSKSNLQRMSSFDCSAPSQNIFGKNINAKMCPNIQSSDLLELQSFKKSNFLYPQNKKQTAKALISLDKQKKESLSSKKRNSRIKINNRNSDKYKESFHQDFLTQESQITISSPSHPMFNEKLKLNNSPNLESERQSKSSMSKNGFEESTLMETKKFNQTFENISEQFSKITLNESKQSVQGNSVQKKPDEIKFCINHPEKQAKFLLNKQIDKPYYCSKCTVLLVTQGYKVIKNLQSKTNRLEKLKNFIFSLQLIEPILSKSKLEIGFLQRQANNLIKNSQDQIERYYKKLHETLDQHKQNTIKALNFHSQKIILQLSMFKQNLSENQKELSFMKSDILPNVDLIVNEEKLPQQSFKQIIKEHEQKLQNIDSLIQKIQKFTQGKDKKITIKSVQIPLKEIKSALNILQRTQIVFIDKTIKVDSKQYESALQLNANTKKETDKFDETKKDFSFDDENIDTSFYVPSSKKKNRQQSPSIVENFYELTDSIRLSFGNKFENNPSSMQSPTFKAI